jgi:hypothetical protein
MANFPAVLQYRPVRFVVRLKIGLDRVTVGGTGVFGHAAEQLVFFR